MLVWFAAFVGVVAHAYHFGASLFSNSKTATVSLFLDNNIILTSIQDMEIF